MASSGDDRLILTTVVMAVIATSGITNLAVRLLVVVAVCALVGLLVSLWRARR